MDLASSLFDRHLTLVVVVAAATLASSLVRRSSASCAPSDAAYPPDYGPKLCAENGAAPPSFHFVVCGGGSAGSVLASRLSEVAAWTVLLLERGADPGADTSVPIQSINLPRSSVDYQYASEPDPRLYGGLADHVASIPRGKVSGGCSTINGCIYMRGNRRDFDGWAAAGALGWNYDAVLPYFRKAEDYGGPQPTAARLGSGGPLGLERPVVYDPALDVFARGLRQLGVPALDDLDGAAPLGYGVAKATAARGRRCSAFNAYTSRCAARPNYAYARNVTVRRIVFDEGGRATGVEVAAPNGRVCVVRADREVIASMGVIGSPQALMLSGIGPTESLRRVGVAPRVDLPVGHNYQDHFAYIGFVMSDRENRSQADIASESAALVANTSQLARDNVTTIGLQEFNALVRATSHDSSTPPYPDTLLRFARQPYRRSRQTWNGKHLLYNLFGVADKTCDLFDVYTNRTDLLHVFVHLLRPRSRGRLQLRSADPADHPRVDPRFLSDPRDEQAMVRALRFVERLGRTPALLDYGLRLVRVDYPACAADASFSDAYWKCALRQIGTGLYHPAGTVKMGAADDKSAVLTPDLRVKGVRGLRVVDASCMPELPSANINAAVIMMAEKASDVIKSDYGVMNGRAGN